MDSLYKTKSTKKRLIKTVEQLATELIMWQRNYNNLSEEFDKSDGKKRLQVLIKPAADIIDNIMFQE